MNGLDVHDAPARDRYEASLDGEVVGFVDYRRGPAGELLLTHAEVAPRVGGRGVGTAMVRATLDDLAERGERIVPVCSFIRAFVRDHPEYQPLVP